MPDIDSPIPDLTRHGSLRRHHLFGRSDGHLIGVGHRVAQEIEQPVTLVLLTVGGNWGSPVFSRGGDIASAFIGSAS